MSKGLVSRRLVTDNTGKVLPVYSYTATGKTDKKGRPLHHGTVQLCNEGDIVFEVELNLSSNGWFSVFKGVLKGNTVCLEKLDSAEANPYWTLLESNKLANDFISEEPHVGTSLPAGLGWDGQTTIVDKNKLKYFNNFLNGLGRNDVEAIKNAVINNGKLHSVPLTWKKSMLRAGDSIIACNLKQIDTEAYTHVIYWETKSTAKRLRTKTIPDTAFRALLVNAEPFSWELVVNDTESAISLLAMSYLDMIQDNADELLEFGYSTAQLEDCLFRLANIEHTVLGYTTLGMVISILHSVSVVDIQTEYTRLHNL